MDTWNEGDMAQTIMIRMINRMEEVNNEAVKEIKASVFNTCEKSYFDKGETENDVALCSLAVLL